MAKLTNTQIDALVTEARNKIEDANKSKVEKFAKTNKKLAEYLKLHKQEQDLNEKRRALEQQVNSLRYDLNDSAEFKKNNITINYNGKIEMETYRLASELRNKITIMTIEKDLDVSTMIQKLIAEYIK
jgi:lipid II:glycine glycyltransferase (peptidoglycan interpeptide bridge formation enzyme)